MPDVKYLFCHTAAADIRNVDAAVIDIWHKKKGWTGIGYHYVILDDRHDHKPDGTIETGRPESKNGAHVLGVNSVSLGICCAGHGDIRDFTAAQKRSLIDLLARLARKCGVPPNRVLGHNEVNDLVAQGIVDEKYKTNKTCPGRKVDMDEIRNLVERELQGGKVSAEPLSRTAETEQTEEVIEAIRVVAAHENLLGNALQEWRDFVFNGEIQGLLRR